MKHFNIFKEGVFLAAISDRLISGARGVGDAGIRANLTAELVRNRRAANHDLDPIAYPRILGSIAKQECSVEPDDH